MPLDLPKDDEGKKGAPRYLVAYCALFTLLLAFFISLQTFGPQAGGALYHPGLGPLAGGPPSFGGGGVFEKGGGKMIHAETGPRYKATEGAEEPPRLRRIDPELEDAQQALAELQRKFDVRTPTSASGYHVQLSTPRSPTGGEGAEDVEEREFLAKLSPTLERVLLSRGFIVRVTAVLPAAQSADAGATEAALAAASELKRKLIEGMNRAARETAARRIYTFVGCGPAEAPARQLKVDIVLTKPYVTEFKQQGDLANEARVSH
jgi:hypothetical protein